MLKPIAGLLTLAAVLSTTEASAQGFFRRSSPRPAATYMAPATVKPVSSASSTTTAPAATATRVYSYSYYTRSTLPARTYVGYGPGDFAFHGTPYGHPYDPYTWSAMDYSSGSILARYYDPPVK